MIDNQEAIRILRESDVIDLTIGKTPAREAVNMAISALQEQEAKYSTESSSTQKALDTISRQAAIDECNKRGAEHIGYAIAHLPSAQPKQKWIPCKTGILPEERDKFYQATYLLDNGDRIVDYVYFNSKGIWSNYAYEYSELLAWMPLPEAYKEDNR